MVRFVGCDDKWSLYGILTWQTTVVKHNQITVEERKGIDWVKVFEP